MTWIMEILRIFLGEKVPIKYYLIKYLVLQNTQNMMGINVDLFQWFINLLVKCLQEEEVAPWCSGYHYCTTSFNKTSTQVLRRFPARGVLEIWVGEDLWQWSRLEMRLNAFRLSTIPQKQFIIIIMVLKMELCQTSNYLKNCTNQLLENLKNEKCTHLLMAIFGLPIWHICS